MKRKLYLLTALSLTATAFAFTGCRKNRETSGQNVVSETTESKDTENVEIGGDISKEDFDNLHDRSC